MTKSIWNSTCLWGMGFQIAPGAFHCSILELQQTNTHAGRTAFLGSHQSDFTLKQNPVWLGWFRTLRGHPWLLTWDWSIELTAFVLVCFGVSRGFLNLVTLQLGLQEIRKLAVYGDTLSVLLHIKTISADLSDSYHNNGKWKIQSRRIFFPMSCVTVCV